MAVTHASEQQPRRTTAPSAKRKQPAAEARRAASGRIVSVTCSLPAVMNLTLKDEHRTLNLHAANYFKIDFLTINWKPPDPFHPCQHIKGLWARAVYTPVQGRSYVGEVISIELEK